MFELLRQGLEQAVQSCDQAELYAERGDVLSIDLERNEVKKMKHVRSTGIGVRVIIGQKIGFAHTTDLEGGKLEECVAHALKQARVSERDASFSGLPGAGSEPLRRGYAEPAQTYDQRIVELLRHEDGSEEAIAYCSELLAGMDEQAVKPGVSCTPTEGSFAAGLDETFIVNSEGIETYDKGTYVSAGLSVVASDMSGEETSGYEGKVTRMLTDLDFRWIGREAVKLAAEGLGGAKFQTKVLPVVLSPKAVQSLFAYTLMPQLSAESVQRKQSPYVGKKGELIAAETLTLVDDGTMPLGVNSRRMDGEGVPSQPTTLVDRGVLQNFFYDSYTAHKDRVESTGNAVRSFDSLPIPGPTNFIITADRNGSTSTESLIHEIREGLFVTDLIGAHTASRASGDFSVVAQNAFGIRSGELFPLKHAMISGNSQEVLRRVSLLGDDTRQIYTVVSPSLLIASLQVIA
jgi:PmbA protein